MGKEAVPPATKVGALIDVNIDKTRQNAQELTVQQVVVEVGPEQERSCKLLAFPMSFSWSLYCTNIFDLVELVSAWL